VSYRPVCKHLPLDKPAFTVLKNVASRSSDLAVVKVDHLVMLTPEEIAIIKAEIDRLEQARKECIDSGIAKWIDAGIEEQKKKLAFGNNPK
jgi:hypothetical protein